MNARRAAVAVLLLSLGATRARALEAPVATRPEHPKRLLVTGGLVFLDSWRPLTPQLSGFFQISLFPTEVSGGNGAPEIIQAPHLYLHLGASGGYRFAQPDPQAYAIGQLGVLWRTGGQGTGPITELGVVGAIVWPQRQAGPLARVEIMDNVGVFGGPLFGWDGRNNGAIVGVDYMRDLFKDLGLVP